MRPSEAVMALSRLGFRFRLEGDVVKVRFEGEQPPNPVAVSPLLDLVRQHKEKVREFLGCHCPKCGGVVFVGPECFLCDWMPKTKKAPHRQAHRETTNVCGGCAHYLTSNMNPSQGFGLCNLAHLSKRPGAYPCRTACPYYERTVGDDTLCLAH